MVYLHDVSIWINKIQELKEASKHPELGALGEGLITLIDQKLSQLDKRLNEISSKITISTIPVPQTKQRELISEIVPEKPQIMEIETKIEVQKSKDEYGTKPFIEIPIPANHKLVEITTLTEIPNK